MVNLIAHLRSKSRWRGSLIGSVELVRQRSYNLSSLSIPECVAQVRGQERNKEPKMYSAASADRRDSRLERLQGHKLAELAPARLEARRA